MTTWLESPGSLPSGLEITPLLSQGKRKVIASNISGEDTIYQTCPPNFQAPVSLCGEAATWKAGMLTSSRPQQEEIRTHTTQATGLYAEQTPYWHAMWLAESQPQRDSAWLDLQGFES